MRNKMAGKVIFSIILSTFVITFLGCTKATVTKEQYDKLEPGMTAEQVKEVMGEPSKMKGENWIYFSDEDEYELEMMGDRLLRKHRYLRGQ